VYKKLYFLVFCKPYRRLDNALADIEITGGKLGIVSGYYVSPSGDNLSRIDLGISFTIDSPFRPRNRD
jgi:hypothetical protein